MLINTPGFSACPLSCSYFCILCGYIQNVSFCLVVVNSHFDSRSTDHFLYCLYTFQTLVAQGANTDTQSLLGYTPLIFAVRFNRLAVVEALIALGAVTSFLIKMRTLLFTSVTCIVMLKRWIFFGVFMRAANVFPTQYRRSDRHERQQRQYSAWSCSKKGVCRHR